MTPPTDTDDSPYARGHRDGYAGDRIDHDLTMTYPEYRRGLADGRTQRIDEDLIAKAAAGEIVDIGEPGPRSQARKIRAYHAARARHGLI